MQQQYYGIVLVESVLCSQYAVMGEVFSRLSCAVKVEGTKGTLALADGGLTGRFGCSMWLD